MYIKLVSINGKSGGNPCVCCGKKSVETQKEKKEKKNLPKKKKVTTSALIYVQQLRKQDGFQNKT